MRQFRVHQLHRTFACPWGEQGGNLAMMACRAAAVLLLAIALGWSSGRASEPVTVEVFQPIAVEGDWLSLSRVTYVGFYDDFVGGVFSAVGMTCDSNAVITHKGVENRNAAYDAGLKVDAVWNTRSNEALFGDTMRVVLDVRSLARHDDYAWSDSSLIAGTVQCIVATAAQLPAAHFVDLRVEGTPAFGGVYSTRHFRCGPPKRTF